MQYKVTLASVKELFESKGYELLENESFGARHKYKYRCPKHPNEELSMRYDKLKAGQECPKCSLEKQADKRRLSFEFVKSEFEKRGYILLSNKYIRADIKLKYICMLHPDQEQFITYGNLHNGQGCPQCGRERQTVKVRNSIDLIREKFDKRGYILLEENYKSGKQKIKYKCRKHPNEILYITYNSFNNGCGCPFCAIESRSGENNYNWKGGLSPLHNFLRGKIGEWKSKSLKEFKNICFITGEKTDNLHVHHAEKTFSLILNEILNKTNIPIYENISFYSNKELKLLVFEIQKAHENITGVPMRVDLHKLFHSIYGYDGKTTFDDLLEFKQKYLNGELFSFTT